MINDGKGGLVHRVPYTESREIQNPFHGQKINRQKYLKLNAVARSFGVVARRISSAVMCSNETLIDICICRLFIISWEDVLNIELGI